MFSAPKSYWDFRETGLISNGCFTLISRFPASRKTNIGQVFYLLIYFFQLFGFLLGKRKHQTAVILLIAAMSVQGVMNLKVQFVSTITPNKPVRERCIECIGNASTSFIGCYEVTQGAGSKFVPHDSSIVQFDTKLLEGTKLT